MVFSLRQAWAGVVLAAGLLAGVVQAQTGEYPNRPVRIIVPAPAGGATDKAARVVGQEMSTVLRQPVVIENRPGAGNIVGMQAGARSPADGYTITITGMINTVVAGLYDTLPYDLMKDFDHVGAIAGGSQWLVVRADAGINSLADFISQARREPGKINYATSGAGSTGHLLIELLQRTTSVQLTHVPYKGGAPALQDTLAGVVAAVVIPAAAVEPHVRAGKLKVLATSFDRREPKFPDVPTFAELGYKPLTVSSYAGLSVPRGTPPEAVRRIDAALTAALKAPKVVAALEADGLVPMSTTPDEYTRLLQNDLTRWTQLVRALNLKAN